VALVNFYKAMGGGWSTECGPNQFDAPSICQSPQFPDQVNYPQDEQVNISRRNLNHPDAIGNASNHRFERSRNLPASVSRPIPYAAHRRPEHAIYRTEVKSNQTDQPIQKPQFPNRYAFYHQQVDKPYPPIHTRQGSTRQHNNRKPPQVRPTKRSADQVEQESWKNQPPIQIPALPTTKRYWYESQSQSRQNFDPRL